MMISWLLEDRVKVLEWLLTHECLDGFMRKDGHGFILN